VGLGASNFGEHAWGPSSVGPIWSPPTFATGSHFSLSTVGSLQCFPDLLAKFKGRRKEELGKRMGEQGRDG